MPYTIDRCPRCGCEKWASIIPDAGPQLCHVCHAKEERAMTVPVVPLCSCSGRTSSLVGFHDPDCPLYYVAPVVTSNQTTMTDTERDELTLRRQTVMARPLCPICGYGLVPCPFSDRKVWKCNRAFSSVTTPRRHIIYWHDTDLANWGKER